MRICTFFGHRETPEEIKIKLSSAIEDLIVNHGVDTFYMGCEGKFDAYARAAAKRGVSKGVRKRTPFEKGRPAGQELCGLSQAKKWTVYA